MCWRIFHVDDCTIPSRGAFDWRGNNTELNRDALSGKMIL